MNRSPERNEDSQSRSAIVPEAAFDGNFMTLPEASSKDQKASPQIPAPVPSAPITRDDFRDRPTVPTQR